MTRLTAKEKTTLFLALEEYASGFTLSLSETEHEQTRELAQRILDASVLSIEE